MFRNCLLVLISLILVCCSESTSGDDMFVQDAPELPSIPSKFFSGIIQDTFYLYVSFPRNYDHERPESYDVVYILDGDWNFTGNRLYHDENPVYLQLLDSLTNDGYLPPCLAVGIGYGPEKWWKRYRDYYTPIDTMYNEYGHADDFYKFLKQELIPLVDESLNTTKSEGRILTGHSGGGYFVMYAAFMYDKNEEVVFNKFLSSSSMIEHYDYNLLGVMNQCREKNEEDFPYKFFYSFAQAEHPREELKQFNDSLQNYITDFRYQEFFGTNHGTVARPAFYYGLRWLYGTDFIYL